MCCLQVEASANEGGDALRENMRPEVVGQLQRAIQAAHQVHRSRQLQRALLPAQQNQGLGLAHQGV